MVTSGSGFNGEEPLETRKMAGWGTSSLMS